MQHSPKSGNSLTEKMITGTLREPNLIINKNNKINKIVLNTSSNNHRCTWKIEGFTFITFYYYY